MRTREARGRGYGAWHRGRKSALAKRGIGAPQMPGFNESLRLLVESERYSLTDIGLMFDLSRERIRQLCARLGIVHPDGRAVGVNAAIRAWDDNANRFQPVSRRLVNRQIRDREISARRAARQQDIQRRRAAIVASVVDLRESLRREPTMKEIYFAIGDGSAIRCYTAWILKEWPTQGLRTSKEKLADFRRATDTTPLRVGRPRNPDAAPPAERSSEHPSAALPSDLPPNTQDNG